MGTAGTADLGYTGANHVSSTTKISPSDRITALNHVQQLADITGPVIGLHQTSVFLFIFVTTSLW
jgi:hypothetical protein